MTLSPELLAVLVCPRCKGPLVCRPNGGGSLASADGGLDCEICRLSYPVRDGIPIMLVDDASALAAG